MASTPAAAEIYTPALVKTLKTELAKYERRLENVKVDFDASFELCLELDRFDFLILELQDRQQMSWLAGYVMGRAVPSIKVCHLDEGETETTAVLPAIVARHAPEHTTESPVVDRRTLDELLAGVTAHVAKFATERIEFHTKAAGQR